MPYYCKKCGSVVIGKYCSCCGTRATSDLVDFRKTERRMGRDMTRNAESDPRFSGMDSLYASRIASLALDIAFNRIIPKEALNVDNFGSYSDYCWKKLPECRELADLLYEQAVELLLVRR